MCTIGILKYEASMIFKTKTGTQATKNAHVVNSSLPKYL